MYLPLNLRTRLLPNKLDSLLKLHSYKILDLFFFKKSLILDFPGGPVGKGLCFHRRRRKFDPPSREVRSHMSGTWPRQNKQKMSLVLILAIPLLVIFETNVNMFTPVKLYPVDCSPWIKPTRICHPNY